MPIDTTSQTALIVLAVAVSIQTFLLGSLAVFILLRWRRLEDDLDRRYRQLLARLDDTMGPLRQAAESVQRVSDRTSAAMDHAGQLANHARAWFAIPRGLVTAGLASAASLLLRRWRRQRRAAASPPRLAPGPRAVH